MDKDESRRKRELYLEAFSTPAGKTVLADILNLLGWFDNDPRAIDPNCVAVANSILINLGAMRAENVGLLTEAMVEVGRNE